MKSELTTRPSNPGMKSESMLASSKSHRLIQMLLSPGGRAFIALVLVLLMGLIFNADGAFLKTGTHRDTLRQASVYGILACGMTLVIITAGIDLSVGSVLGFVAVCFSLMSIHFSLPAWISIPFCLLIGAACGAVSGTLTAWFKVQPFIATLAMMVFARGLAKYVSGGRKIATAVQNPDGTYRYVDLPQIFRAIDSRIFGGNLAMVTVIFAVCLAIVWIAVARHRWGRQLFALGGERRSCPVVWGSGELGKTHGICDIRDAVCGCRYLSGCAGTTG